MTEQKQHRWRHVPHQHRGPHQHKGAADHIGPSCITAPSSRKASPPSWARPTVRRTATPSKRWGRRCVSSACRQDQGQVVRAGTSQGAAGIREASTQYFPYMFEYDVDVLTFFRIVDCGDIPIVPGNNEESHQYIYHYRPSACMAAQRSCCAAAIIRCRSCLPAPFPIFTDRPHRLSPRRLPSGCCAD